jgi:hypothetical protein
MDKNKVLIVLKAAQLEVSWTEPQAFDFLEEVVLLGPR